MSQLNVPASTLHRAIADLAEFLERYTSVDNEASTQWDFLDNGETLEISVVLLNEFRQSDAWNALEARYEGVGGNIYSPDDNEWEA
ncbi:hypothetical protein H6F96_19630 [Microcoleus sp. FACHB-53]|nr:hypothetical protein [Microcoleus sp. FACHB-53]